MKQKILIAILILLIVAVSGVWIYMFFFAPENGGGDIFANFGTDDGATERPVATPPAPDTATTTRPESDSSGRLRQISVRRIAAATFIDEGLRYIERGTGYVFESTLSGSNETKVTNTTVPRVVEAVFSPSGSRVAMTSEENDGQDAIVGTITKNDAGEGVVDGVSLPEGARELRFSDTGEVLYYLVENEQGSSGYAYDLAEQTQTELFSIPLSDVEVLWGETIYVYTTPTAHQLGHLYRIGNRGLSYVIEGRPGLMAERFDDLFLVSESDTQAVETSRLSDGSLESFPLRVFPEKCAVNKTATSSLYCAAPETIPPGTYPDDWYKGVVSFSDSIWSYAAEDGVSQLMDLSEAAGRDLDVVSMYSSNDGTYLAFINKNDDSLWLYELEAN